MTFGTTFLQIFLIPNSSCKIKQSSGYASAFGYLARCYLAVHFNDSFHFLHIVSAACWTWSTFTFLIFNRVSTGIKSPCALFWSRISESMLAINCLQLFSNLFIIFTCFCEETNDDSFFRFFIHIKSRHTVLSYVEKNLCTDTKTHLIITKFIPHIPNACWYTGPLKTRSHSRIKSSELTAVNRRMANTHSSDLRMKSP